MKKMMSGHQATVWLQPVCVILVGLFFFGTVAHARMPVPTCGRGVVSSDGQYHFDWHRYVKWTGRGAPTEPCNNPGFSEDGQPNPMNAYAWSMASFGDHLYVGTLNRVNDKIHDSGDISEGGEVWRYKSGPTVNSGVWQQDADPGFGDLSNYGIRAMMVYNDQLYAGTFNRENGTQLWRRSLDTAAGPGQWQIIADAGFGDVGNDSVRSMAVFNGQLYLGMKNNISGAYLFKYDADTEVVSLVCGGTDGILRETEDVVSELVSFGDHLWILTWGTVGVGVYRMDLQENIEAVSTEGVDKFNSGIMSSAVYNGKIYLGTVNLYTGAQLYVLENASAADPMDVVLKRVGANVFQSTEAYLWRMQAFEGQLYIGTWNPFNTFRPLQWEKYGATLYRMDESEDFCQVIGNRKLIEEGFGQTVNYGIRSMAEHSGRLFIGTAQPFKVEPGSNDTPAASRDGMEVWEFDPAK